MNDVERFISDLQQLFSSGASDKDQLKASAHRALSAFIGRLVVRDNAYAPLDEVHRPLSEARQRLVSLSFEGEGRYLRIEMLTELDKALRPRPGGSRRNQRTTNELCRAAAASVGWPFSRRVADRRSWSS